MASSPTRLSYRARRLEASANAPWTRTMVGPAMRTTPFKVGFRAGLPVGAAAGEDTFDGQRRQESPRLSRRAAARRDRDCGPGGGCAPPPADPEPEDARDAPHTARRAHRQAAVAAR